MPKAALILSGCGVFDGSEIHEAVLCALHLSKAGFAIDYLAPSSTTLAEVNHLSGETTGQKRAVLAESARIARGAVHGLNATSPDQYDCAVLPGGFGAAKNLCNFAIAGADMSINPELQQFLKPMVMSKKPLLFACIAPVMIPKLYPRGVKLTIGNDRETAAKITAMGGEHIETAVDHYVFDEAYQVISTPAYMLAQSITEVESGIAQSIALLKSLVH